MEWTIKPAEIAAVEYDHYLWFNFVRSITEPTIVLIFCYFVFKFLMFLMRWFKDNV